mgnify:CR=1 FL=1
MGGAKKNEQILKARGEELEKKSRQIEEKLSEVERLNKLMVGRELRMIELKKEIAQLTREQGERTA